MSSCPWCRHTVPDTLTGSDFELIEQHMILNKRIRQLCQGGLLKEKVSPDFAAYLALEGNPYGGKDTGQGTMIEYK